MAIKNTLVKADLELKGVDGNNFCMTYIFTCGCELPTDYDKYFQPTKQCGNHQKRELVRLISNITDWSTVPLLD